MALKVELKPHERIIIGSCVVTNTDQRARLLIDGDNIPILREKDILTPETAEHARQARLSGGAADVHLAGSAEPATAPISTWCATSSSPCRAPGRSSRASTTASSSGDLYQALKEAKKLIAYEKKLLDQHETIEASRKAEVAERRPASLR